MKANSKQSSEKFMIAYAFRNTVLKSYHLANAKQDLLAGVVVGILAMPMAMALAIASGVPPQHGLYTAIIAGALIALLGGSSVNISGPTAAFVVILLPITQSYGVGGLLIATVMAGVILLIMGITGMGRFIQFIPYPVTTGFTTGIAVVIATLQLKDFFGMYDLNLMGHYWEKISLLVSAFPSAHWQDTLIGCITLIFMVWKLPIYRYVPAHAVALIIGTSVAYVLSINLENFSVATIGSNFHYTIDGVKGSGLPSVLPHWVWPWDFPDALGQPLIISWDFIQHLVGPTFAIAMLAAIESLLCSVVADSLSGTRHQANSELMAQGIGNIVAPFFGGMTAAAAISRTATSIRAGGKTPLAAIVHSILILAALAWFASYLSMIPMASLACLLLIVAWNLSAPRHFLHLVKNAPRSDVAVLLVCTLLTIFFDMVIAVGVGIVLAALLFIIRMSELTASQLLHQSTHEDIRDFPDDVIVYDINGPLFFGATEKALQSIHILKSEINFVVLEMHDVKLLDVSGMMALESLIHSLNHDDIVVIIVKLDQQLAKNLRKISLKLNDDKLYFADSLKTAKMMITKLQA